MTPFIVNVVITKHFEYKASISSIGIETTDTRIIVAIGAAIKAYVDRRKEMKLLAQYSQHKTISELDIFLYSNELLFEISYIVEEFEEDCATGKTIVNKSFILVKTKNDEITYCDHPLMLQIISDIGKSVTGYKLISFDLHTLENFSFSETTIYPNEEYQKLGFGF